MNYIFNALKRSVAKAFLYSIYLLASIDEKMAMRFVKFTDKAFPIVADIAIQVLFYATLIAGFWLLSFLMP